MHDLLRRFTEGLFSPERLRIRGRERILLLKRIAMYLRAGIPIVEAIGVIEASPGSSSQKRLLRALMLDIQSGIPLSRALARFPRTYAPTHLHLIAVGEVSGTLPNALFSLAGLLEDGARRIRSTIGSLAYPAVLFIGSISICIFLLLYVFPKIIPLFRGLHAQLPFTTRILISVSTFIQDHWLLLLAGIVVSGLTIVFVFRAKRTKVFLDPLVLHIPFFGRLMQAVIIATVFRILATLLSTGTQLDEAIRLARDSTSNTAARMALARIRETVLAGDRLSVAFGAESILFPPLALQLALVGEMTGSLSESMGSAAQIFEEELSDQLRVLTSVLEPLIMVAMGLIIGCIALAIISPMYGITQSLSS